MLEKFVTSSRNVLDFARYQRERNDAGNTPALSARLCRHCGAALLEGEREDECSSVLSVSTPRLRGGPRKFYAD